MLLWWQAVRAALCGGSRQLTDIAYVRRPAACTGSALSRFGFQAQSSGTLQVRHLSLISPATLRLLSAAECRDSCMVTFASGI